MARNSELEELCAEISKSCTTLNPPATKEEIRASALKFVRKLGGFNTPSKVNERAFNQAVDQVTDAATVLINSLFTLSPPRDREAEQAKFALLLAKRFGRS